MVMRYLPQVVEGIGAGAILWAVGVLLSPEVAILVGGIGLMLVARVLERPE